MLVGATAQTGEALSVLVVEDDPALADLLERLLETIDDGLSVTARTDPEAALADFAAARYDCVVSDYYMPAMNGLQFCEAVRERAPEMPCILFTCDGTEEMARRARERGVPVMEKRGRPDQYRELAARIRRRTGAS